MTLWIKEQNSALPRDGAARAASPPACAACILPSVPKPFAAKSAFRKLAWPAKTKGRYRAAMLRHEFQGSCLADSVEPYQKQEQIQPHQKAVSRLFGGDGLLLKQERIQASFLQCRPLSARPRPAGEALPDARIRLSVGYTLPSLKSPAARAFSMLEKLLQKPQQTCGWGIFSPLSCAPKRIRECHNPPRFFQRWSSVFRLVFRHFRQPPASHACAAVSPRFSPLRHMRRGLFFLSLLARP